MPSRELRLERLLDRRVRGIDGKPVGPLEEVRVETRDGRTVIVEYRVGAYALLQRLAGSAIGRSMLLAVGLGAKGGGYRVPWRQMDLSDPERPRLRCDVSELERFDEPA